MDNAASVHVLGGITSTIPKLSVSLTPTIAAVPPVRAVLHPAYAPKALARQIVKRHSPNAMTNVTITRMISTIVADATMHVPQT